MTNEPILTLDPKRVAWLMTRYPRKEAERGVYEMTHYETFGVLPAVTRVVAEVRWDGPQAFYIYHQYSPS